jgi:protease IV
MKQFLYSFLGTIAGIVVSVIILFFITIGLVVGLVSSSVDDKPLKLKNNSVLHITLNQPIKERSPKNPFQNFDFTSFESRNTLGLDDILKNIEKAKTDKNIKGIFLEITSVNAGIATVEEIRNALLDFKKESHKFIVSYSEIYTQKAYYLSSVADKVYINREGLLEFKGLSAQIMFYKNLLEKLEIQIQVFKHGKFKSAIEPYSLEKMSEANRAQTKVYVSSLWEHILNGISKERKISVADLNKMADEMLIQNARDAVKYKLADELKYKDEVISDLKGRLSIKEKEKINFVELGAYKRSPKTLADKFVKDKIAMVYAVGAIESGEGDDEKIGSERISSAIREARQDSSVKAIVLRVNSPGGSALASDVIWREVEIAARYKPVVVSMGDVAASGGYYIACAAHTIVAEPNTITGSIGVFGILPNAQKFFNDKLGITVDTVNSNKHSDIGSIFRPVTTAEGMVIQQAVENIYTDFINKVAKGRHMRAAEVDSIGQGRVWSGVDAKRIGLVDEIGGIELALSIAAGKANLKKYSIISLPKQKDAFEEILKSFKSEMSEKFAKAGLGQEYDSYTKLKAALETKGIQARLPFEILIY